MRDFDEKNNDSQLGDWIKDIYRHKEKGSHMISDQMIEKVTVQFKDYARRFGGPSNCSYTQIKEFASEIEMSPIKVRKILITQGIYVNDKSELVGKLDDEGKSVEEIQQITGLKRATVYSYLPYKSSTYHPNREFG